MADKLGSDKFERDLLRGSLDLMILSVLASGKKYGYLLQQQLRDASGGRVEIAAGTLYPLLHRLKDKLIRSSWDDDTGRKRKWYELTAAGQRRLKTQAQEWLDYAACVRELLQSASIIVPKPA